MGVVGYEGMEGLALGILYHFGSHLLGLAVFHASYDSFADGSAARIELAIFVLILFLPADKGFVNLDRAVQHGGGLFVGLSDTMEHEPSRFLRDGEVSVELHAADAL